MASFIRVRNGVPVPGQSFPLGEQPPASIRKKYDVTKVDCVAVPTGEKRPPRKGEWFLSGSLVEGYIAYDDMQVPYYIAKLHRKFRVETVQIGEELA